MAATRASGERHAPGSEAGTEALAARVVFDAAAAGDLTYFGPVASMPGFPKALARTLHELRLAGVSPVQMAASGVAAADIGGLLARMEAELERAGVDDRAALFHVATEACTETTSTTSTTSSSRVSEQSLVLLDVAVNSRAERDFLAALVARSADTLVTVPDGDQRTLDAFAAGENVRLPDAAAASSDLSHLRQYVFTNVEPPVRQPAGDVRLFSAPGEGREAIEMVRRVLDEASRGTPFDEMAILLRAPRQYLGLLEHACARAGVPVYFDRGTRRPDPAGRAFVALLSSAVEGLSAKRFDEYLSLGQVPRVDRQRTAGTRRIRPGPRGRATKCSRNSSPTSTPRTRMPTTIRRRSIPTTKRSSPARFDRRGNGKSSSWSRLWLAGGRARTAMRDGAGGSMGWRPTIGFAETN